jgi:predicted RNA-binding Zn ribbon-like protein
VRLLCDENVDQRYVETFQSTDWITVKTARDALTADASDETIGNFAEEREWIVFTADDDFLKFDPDCGVVLYQQTDRPSPGTVVDALRAIDDAYADHRTIREFVPGGWTHTE